MNKDEILSSLNDALAMMDSLVFREAYEMLRYDANDSYYYHIVADTVRGVYQQIEYVCYEMEEDQ